MELFLIVLVAVWGQELRVIIYIGTVAVVNSGYSKVVAVMYLLRCFSSGPGVENSWSNSMSRKTLVCFCIRSPIRRASVKLSYQVAWQHFY